MPDLPISPRKVAQVILLSREDNPTAKRELRQFIEALDDDEQIGLVACMWVGRGTFDADDLQEALLTARTQATTTTFDYLNGSPHLAEHLESGLDALGTDVTDVEDDLLGGD